MLDRGCATSCLKPDESFISAALALDFLLVWFDFDSAIKLVDCVGFNGVPWEADPIVW